MAKKLVLPRVHVMVICDGIEESADELGVHHLFGVRTTIKADTFPHVLSELFIYLQMTGHEGASSGSLLLVQGRTDRVLRRKALPRIEFQGPTIAFPVQVRLRNCEFPEAGLYYFQITFEGKLLGERFIELIASEGTES